MKSHSLFKALPFILIGTPVAIGQAVADTGWLEHDQSFQVGPVAVESSSPQLRFLLGSQDLTSLFHEDEVGVYRYQATAFPLPVGEHELVVYEVVDDEWNEVYRDEVKVLSP